MKDKAVNVARDVGVWKIVLTLSQGAEEVSVGLFCKGKLAAWFDDMVRFSLYDNDVLYDNALEMLPAVCEKAQLNRHEAYDITQRYTKTGQKRVRALKEILAPLPAARGCTCEVCEV